MLLILVEVVVLGALVVAGNLPLSNFETLFSSKSLRSRKLMADDDGIEADRDRFGPPMERYQKSVQKDPVQKDPVEKDPAEDASCCVCFKSNVEFNTFECGGTNADGARVGHSDMICTRCLEDIRNWDDKCPICRAPKPKVKRVVRKITDSATQLKQTWWRDWIPQWSSGQRPTPNGSDQNAISSTSTLNPEVTVCDSPKSSGRISIYVDKQLQGEPILQVELPSDSTVADLYTAAGVGIDEQLMFQGKPLTDHALLLSDIGFSAEVTVHVLKKRMKIDVGTTRWDGHDFQLETRTVELPYNALVEDLYAKAGNRCKILLMHFGLPLKDPKKRLMDTRLKTGHTVIVNEIQWQRKRLDELKPIFEVTMRVQDGEHMVENTVFVQWIHSNRFGFRFVEKTASQTWTRSPTGQQNAFHIYLRDLSDYLEMFFQRVGSDMLRLPSVMRFGGGKMTVSLNKVVYWDGTEIQ